MKECQYLALTPDPFSLSPAQPLRRQRCARFGFDQSDVPSIDRAARVHILPEIPCHSRIPRLRFGLSDVGRAHGPVAVRVAHEHAHGHGHVAGECAVAYAGEPHDKRLCIGNVTQIDSHHCATDAEAADGANAREGGSGDRNRIGELDYHLINTGATATTTLHAWRTIRIQVDVESSRATVRLARKGRNRLRRLALACTASVKDGLNFCLR